MSKEILFLSRRDDREQYDTAPSMAASLNSLESPIKYHACFLEDLQIDYDGTELTIFDTTNQRDVSEFDGVFLLGWFKTHKLQELALAVSIYLEHKGKKVLNSEARRNRSRSKLSQLVAAISCNVPVTPFHVVLPGQAFNKDQLKIQFPLIVKSASASRGNDNYLVSNWDELIQSLEAMPTKIRLVQQFIVNDGDYRVIVTGDTVRMVIWRKGEDGSHLNNTSQGGSATLVNVEALDKTMIENCIRISKFLGREVTGVDMIQDKTDGSCYLLEINNMPQLSTGSLVNEKAAALNEFFEEWLVSV